MIKKLPQWLRAYYSIRSRCTNQKSNAWEYYGSRGIKCLVTRDELKAMWERDGADNMTKASIDRIDSNGHYVFSNLRWIERSLNSGRAHRPPMTPQEEKEFKPFTRKEIDKRRSATLTRIETDLYEAIKKIARKEGRDAKDMIEEVLIAEFKIKAPK